MTCFYCGAKAHAPGPWMGLPKCAACKARLDSAIKADRERRATSERLACEGEVIEG